MSRRRKEPATIAEDVVVELTGIAHGGEGVGRYEGEVVFVPFATPGEVVRVDLYRERQGLLRGVIREVVKGSEHRVRPPCPYFGYCGGCQWQHVEYDEQLALKTRIVREQLQRIGRFADPPVNLALASPKQWNYRNHVRFSAGRHGHLGFTRPNSHRFLAVDRCLIAHERINELLSRVQGKGAGLHQVVMRVGEHTDDVLIYPPLASEMVTQHDELEDVLLGQSFRINRSSFFQVNTLQAERLAELVLQRLALTGNEVVVDAYCGVGTFALLLARRAARVIGIEESRSAIQNAERNARDATNVRFIAAKAEQALPELGEEVDGVVLDPARAGCAEEVVDALARLRPSKIVYVSCDPATLARDLRMLVERGFHLSEVQPVDMFPQTHHVENVAVLCDRN